MNELKNINQNSTFIDFDKSHYNASKLVRKISNNKNMIERIDKQIEEVDKFGYGYGFTIRLGTHIDEEISEDLALLILYNMKNWLRVDLANIENEFYQKFPNKDEQGT